MKNFPLDLYLKRIGLSDLGGTTALDLKRLVEAQLYGISFENLDVLARLPISLDPEAIVEKILHRERGGYCYELNGLLGMALEKAGFEFEPKLARVSFNRSGIGPKSHLVFVVKADGLEWLVDVGFGGPGLIAPMPFKLGAQSEQRGTKFRLVEAENDYLHLQRFSQSEWINLYMISPEKVIPVDIEVVNHFISTWERSPFRSLLMCVSHDEEGLKTIRDQELVWLDHELSPVKREKITGAADLKEKLRQNFQVEVPLPLCEEALMRVLIKTK